MLAQLLGTAWLISACGSEADDHGNALLTAQGYSPMASALGTPLGSSAGSSAPDQPNNLDSPPAASPSGAPTASPGASPSNPAASTPSPGALPEDVVTTTPPPLSTPSAGVADPTPHFDAGIDQDDNEPEPASPEAPNGAPPPENETPPPENAAPPSEAELRYNIDLVLDPEVELDPIVLDAFVAAKTRWEQVIIGDLPQISMLGTATCNGFPLPSVIDDLVIFVSIKPIDGPFGVLAAAAPCAIRSRGARLPFAGAMEFDLDDLWLYAELGRLEEIILHEMGHVIGFGSLWSAAGLLHDPSTEDQQRDTWFSGAASTAAFDAAGGFGYIGNKVPVENQGGDGSFNGHWREGVMDDELMTSTLSATAGRLSTVTLGSLADLGYEVAAEAADSYSLPVFSASRSTDGAEPVATHRFVAASPIDLRHDVLRIPLFEHDGAGGLRLLRE